MSDQPTPPHPPIDNKREAVKAELRSRLGTLIDNRHADIRTEIAGRMRDLKDQINLMAGAVVDAHWPTETVPAPSPTGESPIGIYFESDYHHRVEKQPMQLLSAIGIEDVIYRFVWPRFERTPGAMQWDLLEHDLSTLANSFKRIHLIRHGVPAWATIENKPSHEIYEEGCMLLDPFGAFAEDKEYCRNPARPITNDVFNVGRDLAKFVTEKRLPVATWGAGPNEPGIAIYGPEFEAARKGRMTFTEATVRVIEGQTVPFTDGVRSFLPDAKFFGPEADSGQILRWFLEYERDNGLRLWDIVTTHEYLWEGAFPQGSFDRVIHDFRIPSAEIQALLNGRERWNSEFSDRLDDKAPHESSQLVEYVEEYHRRAAELGGKAPLVFWHQWGYLFDKRKGKEDRSEWKPNALYERTAKMIERMRG